MQMRATPGHAAAARSTIDSWSRSVKQPCSLRILHYAPTKSKVTHMGGQAKFAPITSRRGPSSKQSPLQQIAPMAVCKGPPP